MKAPPASSTPGPPTPALIRTLDTGQACYIHRGGATYVQIARPKPSPLPLPAGPGPIGHHSPARTATRTRAGRATGPGTLDDVFGPGVFR